MTTLRVLSYGGGVQSTAMLVLAATGRLDIDAALFANVGDDSEHPATLEYVRNIAVPWAAERGITVHVLDRMVKHRGTTTEVRETLWQRLTRPESRSLPIPVRMSNGAPGTRSCTADFKIRVVGRWLKEHGASEANPATVNIGISVDEIQRANTRRIEPHERISYPLLDLGMRRTDCARLIQDAGLPVPPKSSCFFCPFHRPTVWAAMRAEEPELFERSAQLEDLLNERREALGKDRVYLTRFNKPLRHVVDEGVQLLPLADDGDGSCDSGWCMT
ncbi:phosphoadenosine phosphosulfate reductase [Saccharothrix lopnurensis]|uniref:Phosphoadenosine phosphosulfate reductase n=1 Tax=Saccharothrix lopnurensis TaxID=1670621 RepID=A0ABW1P5Z3_9PSEU